MGLAVPGLLRKAPEVQRARVSSTVHPTLQPAGEGTAAWFSRAVTPSAGVRVLDFGHAEIARGRFLNLPLTLTPATGSGAITRAVLYFVAWLVRNRRHI